MDNFEKENKRLKYLIFVLLTITLLAVVYLTYMLYFNEDKNDTAIDNCVSEKEIPVEEQNKDKNLYYQYAYYDEHDLNDPMAIDEIVFYSDGSVKYKGDGHRTGYSYSGFYTIKDNLISLALLSDDVKPEDLYGEECKALAIGSCSKVVYLEKDSYGNLSEVGSSSNTIYKEVEESDMKLIK